MREQYSALRGLRYEADPALSLHLEDSRVTDSLCVSCLLNFEPQNFHISGTGSVSELLQGRVCDLPIFVTSPMANTE